jgi:hypothetical protein
MARSIIPPYTSSHDFFSIMTSRTGVSVWRTYLFIYLFIYLFRSNLNVFALDKSKKMEVHVQEISKTLQQVIFNHGHEKTELEFRLGRYLNDCFVPGISKKDFEKIYATLDASPFFTKKTSETLERLNGTDAKFDETNNKWMYKKKIAVYDEPRPTSCERGYVQRAAISLEGNGEGPPPPGAPPFVYHRLKKRTSFHHECWSVDMTTVTSNLPHQADNDEEIYELEIELTGEDAVFQYTTEHIVRWGASFMDQLKDLISDM